MKKIIIFTIVANIAFYLFVTQNTAEPKKDLPANAPFITKSNLPSICRVSTMSTATDTKQNIPVVECKFSIATTITSNATSY